MAKEKNVKNRESLWQRMQDFICIFYEKTFKSLKTHRCINVYKTPIKYSNI